MNRKGCGRKQSWINLRHYPAICLEGLRTIVETLNQVSQRPGRDSNQIPPEYKSEALLLSQLAGVLENFVTTQNTLESRFFILRKIPKLEDQLLSAFRYCLFNMLVVTLQVRT
jgi:hypothetical protein